MKNYKDMNDQELVQYYWELNSVAKIEKKVKAELKKRMDEGEVDGVRYGKSSTSEAFMKVDDMKKLLEEKQYKDAEGNVLSFSDLRIESKRAGSILKDNKEKE